jgi:hypothetical protein
VYINDALINEEDVISIEFEDTFDFIYIMGKMIIKDTLRIYNLMDLNESVVIKINIIDNYGKNFIKFFNITSINVESVNTNFRLLKITFIDSLSFLLSTTYISKSFYDTPQNIVTTIFSYLKLEETSLKLNKLKLNLSATNEEKINIITNNDRSVLDFLVYMFKNYGYRFWQSMERVNVEKKFIIDSPEKTFVVNSSDKILTYTNNTAYDEHPFMIYDYRILTNQTLDLNNNNPAISNYQSKNGKSFDLTSINLIDFYDSLILGKQDLKNLCLTKGVKYTTNTTQTIYTQKNDLEDSYFKNVQLEIVVKGNFTAFPLGYIVNVDLKGDAIVQGSEIEGDKMFSGKYFVYRIQEKIIGDKHISKLTLVRMNNN